MNSQINPKIFENIELNLPTHGPIGVFLSGDENSAILLYLIALKVKEKQLPVEIHPITAERLAYPFNLRHAQRTKEEVQNLLGMTFGLHYCYMIPNHQKGFSFDSEQKINGHYGHEFASRFNLKKVYFAHIQTLDENPKHDFSIPELNQQLVEKPLQKLDKYQIASLYKDLNLLKNLFPKTRSCEADMYESHHFRKVCAEIQERQTPCLKCQQRTSAFSSYL